MIPIDKIALVNNPPDLLAWPASLSLTALEFKTPSGVHIDGSKLSGPDRWPDVTPPGWTGSLQYTLGLILNIGGQWIGSAVIEYWFGLDASGGPVLDNSQIPANWYYDARWNGLQHHQPAAGEHVGLLVGAGNLRGVTDGSQSPVKERAAVVEFLWPAAYGPITPVWTEGQPDSPGIPPPPTNLPGLIADEFDKAAAALSQVARLVRLV